MEDIKLYIYAVKNKTTKQRNKNINKTIMLYRWLDFKLPFDVTDVSTFKDLG